MHQGIQRRTKTLGAVLLAAFASVAATSSAQSTAGTARSILEPAIWQGPEMSGQPTPGQAAPAAGSKPVTSNDSMQPVVNPLRVALQPTPPIPPQGVQIVPDTAIAPRPLIPPSQSSEPTLTQPLLDGNAPAEELMPAVVNTGCNEFGGSGRRGVQPYGGGHPWIGRGAAPARRIALGPASATTRRLARVGT